MKVSPDFLVISLKLSLKFSLIFPPRIYPELIKAFDMKPVKTAPFYNIETLQSIGGSNFVSFAKLRLFEKELYDYLAAPYFDSGDYYVESWRHGTDCMKPSKVYNIEQIEF